MKKKSNNMKHLMRNQLAALELGIGALKRERRRNYAAGEHAYNSGIRHSDLVGEISGITLGFAEADHEKYTEYTKAIQQLEDMKEILVDPGVTREQKLLF